jgi:hypothetical protein
VSEATVAVRFDHETQERIAAEAEAGRAKSVRTVIKQQYRKAREAELGAKQVAAPDGKFGVIVEDFEWDHVVWSRETRMDRHAANHFTLGPVVGAKLPRSRCARNGAIDPQLKSRTSASPAAVS